MADKNINDESKEKFNIFGSLFNKDKEVKKENPRDVKDKKEYKKSLRIKKWFGNDDDGLTMTDSLTVFIFVFWVICKTGHIVISLLDSSDAMKLTQINSVISSIDSIMTTMAMFYFGSNAIQHAVNKVHDMNVNKYEIQSETSKNELEAKIIENSIISNTAQYVPHDPNITPVPSTQFEYVSSDTSTTEAPSEYIETSELFP